MIQHPRESTPTLRLFWQKHFSLRAATRRWWVRMMEWSRDDVISACAHTYTRTCNTQRSIMHRDYFQHCISTQKPTPCNKLIQLCCGSVNVPPDDSWASCAQMTDDPTMPQLCANESTNENHSCKVECAARWPWTWSTFARVTRAMSTASSNHVGFTRARLTQSNMQHGNLKALDMDNEQNDLYNYNNKFYIPNRYISIQKKILKQFSHARSCWPLSSSDNWSFA